MRHEKQLLLDEIKDQVTKYQSFVIMKYLGVSANTANAFRREIAGLGGNVEMMRKRVLIKAAEAAGIPLSIDVLPGHIGLVFTGKDPLETAKVVFRYSQETEKAIEVIGGRFDGHLYQAEQMQMLSTLPDKATMRALLLSVFVSPLTETLATLDAILSSVVYCLDNKSKEQGKE